MDKSKPTEADLKEKLKHIEQDIYDLIVPHNQYYTQASEIIRRFFYSFFIILVTQGEVVRAVKSLHAG